MKYTPNQLAMSKMKMASDYARLCEEYGQIRAKQASDWLLERVKHKSATDTDRALDASVDGRRLIVLRHTLKGLEEQMEALTSLLVVLNGESRNQW